MSVKEQIDRIKEEVSSQSEFIAQIKTALQNKVGSSGGLDTSDATATAADILSGKTAYVDGEKITGTIPTQTQETPSISVSSAGLITAFATQSEGYVSSGTKSATKQLTTQEAKTVTPSTSDQTAVASGVYTTGDVIVVGDSNLVASNIKSGVSIFGVVGSYEGSGGSSETVEAVTVGVSVPANTSCSFEVVQDGVVVPAGAVLPFAVSNTWSLQKGSFCYIFPANPFVDPTWTIKTSGDVELLANAVRTQCATFKVNGAGSITISE